MLQYYMCTMRGLRSACASAKSDQSLHRHSIGIQGSTAPLDRQQTLISPRGDLTLQKQAYSNILKSLPPKNENFQMKNSGCFLISAQKQ